MKFFFLVVSLFLFGLFMQPVFGAPPSINFNFTPASPLVFETVTFDPAITSSPDLNFLFWGFDTDGNINYQATQAGVLFYDNFNDTDISDWVQTNGIWNATAGYLTANVNNSNIYHDVNTTILTGDLNLGFRIYLDAAGTSGHLAWNTTANATRTNGYTVQAEQNLITLAKDNTTVASFVVTLPILTNHDINISHKTDGNIQVFLNGEFVGSYTDSTYTTGTRVIFGRGDQKRFDNIRVFGSAAIDPDKNETHVFTTVGTKNVCLTGGNTDGNTTTCKTVQVSGNVRIFVFDENTKLPVSNATAIFQGNSFFASGNLLNISTPTVEGDYVIEVFASNYPSRFFTFQLDVNSSLVESVYLLDRNKARSIQFRVQDENQNTFPNKLFRIEKDGNLITQQYLNADSVSNGVALANLVTDYNYFVDENTEYARLYDYNNVVLEIAKPKNEKTLAEILPFGIEIYLLTSVDVNNLNNPYSLSIYPNTHDPYLVAIDANTLDYIQRYYAVRALPKKTKLIEPYMLRIADGAAISTMHMRDSFSGQAIDRYTVEFYTDVGNQANVLLESGYSDSAGEFIFTSITGKPYSLRVLREDGTRVKTGPFIAGTQVDYYFDLFTGIISFELPQPGFMDVNVIVPSTNTYLLELNDSSNYGFRFQLINTGSSNVSSIIIRADQNGSTIGTKTYNVVFPAITFTSGQVFDLNFTTSNLDSIVAIRVTLVTNAGNVVKNYAYAINAIPGGTFEPPPFNFFKDELDDFSGILLWFFIYCIISVAARHAIQTGLDNNGMVWIMAVWTGLAAFISLIPFVYAFVAIIGGISIWAINRRPVG